MLAASGAAAQDTTEVAQARALFETATTGHVGPGCGGSLGAAAPDSAWTPFCRDLAALCEADAALCRGGFAAFAEGGLALAVERRQDGERRVVALNPSDEDRFVPLPGVGVPAPLVPVFVSSGSVADVPGLVAGVGDVDVVYGLRVPARTAVVFRSVRGADVRPRGLDE